MRRAKLLPLIFGLLGLGVVVVFGVLYKDVAIESWYLREVKSEDEEVQKAAIEKLVALRSVKAVPPLVEMTIHESKIADAAEKALEQIGAPAVGVLARAAMATENSMERRAVYTARNAGVLTLRILEQHPEEIMTVLRVYDAGSVFCDLIIREFFEGRDDISASVVLEPFLGRDAETLCNFLSAVSFHARDSQTARQVLLKSGRASEAQVRECALAAMGKDCCGEPEFESMMISVLKATEEDVRKAASSLLYRCRTTLPTVHIALEETFLRSPELEAPDHALALAACAPDRVVDLLTHESALHRRIAMTTLAELAYAPARDAYLVSFKSDPDGEIRLAALRALGGLGKEAAETVPALLEVVRQGPEELRAPVLLALGEIGSQPDLVVPVLVEYLEKGDIESRRFAAASLEKFGKRATPAIPALIKALEDLATRDWAVYALAACGKEAVSPVAAVFDHRMPRVRWAAVMTIERMGRRAAQVVEQKLGDLLASDPDNSVRVAASMALRNVDKLSQETVKKIEQALQDGDWDVRLHALQIFARRDVTDTRAERILPVVQVAFKDPNVDATQKEDALAILRVLGEEGIPGWIDALDDDNVWIRLGAIEMLSGFGSTASTAIPALKKRLEDEDPAVRQAATNALELVQETQEEWPSVRNNNDVRGERTCSSGNLVQPVSRTG